MMPLAPRCRRRKVSIWSRGLSFASAGSREDSYKREDDYKKDKDKDKDKNKEKNKKKDRKREREDKAVGVERRRHKVCKR